PPAPRQELGIQQEKWQRAEMIAMQMRKDDAVDAIGIKSARLQRHERGGAEVDEQRALPRFEKKAGVEPATGAESIATSDDAQAHGQADALGRAAISACQRLRCLRSSGTASLAGFMKSTATSPVTAPEQRRIGVERLEIAADRDRFGSTVPSSSTSAGTRLSGLIAA